MSRALGSGPDSCPSEGESSSVKSSSAIGAQPTGPGEEGEGGDRTTTRSVTRCGCCLPALTRLARRPPAADLRAGIWRMQRGFATCAGSQGLVVQFQLAFGRALQETEAE